MFVCIDQLNDVLVGRIKPSESFFTYLPGTNYSTYNDLTFVPDFGPPAFNDTALYAEVLEVCGDNEECIYDAARTQSIAVGKASRIADETFQQQEAELGETTSNISYCCNCKISDCGLMIFSRSNSTRDYSPRHTQHDASRDSCSSHHSEASALKCLFQSH